VVEEAGVPGATDNGEATGKLYHLRIECTLFCNLQIRSRTYAVLVIDLHGHHQNVTRSRHDIAEKLFSLQKASITHSL
jgi:hypothetical protein